MPRVRGDPIPQATRPTGTLNRSAMASPNGGKKLPPPPLAADTNAPLQARAPLKTKSCRLARRGESAIGLPQLSSSKSPWPLPACPVHDAALALAIQVAVAPEFIDQRFRDPNNVGGSPSTQTVSTWGAGALDGSGVVVTSGGGITTSCPGYYRWVRLTTGVIVDAVPLDSLGTILISVTNASWTIGSRNWPLRRLVGDR